MVNKRETVSRASKGHIEGYYNSATAISKDNRELYGAKPVFDRDKALEAIRKDSTVLGALNTLVDRAMKNGYQLSGVDGKSKATTAKKVLEETLRLKKVTRQVFFNLFGYNNAFIENIKDGSGNVKELHLLETTHTEPVATIHGEILGYIQVLTAKDKQKTSPDWSPEEVTFIPITKLTTNVWGELDIESIYTSVLLKQYIMQYLGWLFGTNQFKGFYNIKNANDAQVKGFLSYLKGAENDISKPVIAEGDVVYEILRDFSDGDTIISLLNKLDGNILALMQVPPIEAGIAGDSNRSNSDAQETSLLTRIKAVQDVVEDYYNHDLFQKIGYDKVRIQFNPLVKADLTKLLEQAEKMSIIGFKLDVIEEYLKNEGFPVNGKLLMTDEEKAAKAEMMMPKVDEKSDEQRPSRKRKDDGDSNEKIGTGKEGTTRDDQVSRGLPDFNSYPYTLD